MTANPTIIVMHFIWIKLLLKQILYHCLILESIRSFKGDTIQERCVSCFKIKLSWGGYTSCRRSTVIIYEVKPTARGVWGSSPNRPAASFFSPHHNYKYHHSRCT